MSRQKRKPPRPHESTRSSDSFVRIFADQMASAAWQGITSGQRDLYQCMKLASKHRTRKENSLIRTLPESLNETKTGKTIKANKDDLLFFNRYRWHKPKKGSVEAAAPPKIHYEFRLYSNQSQFYKDRNALMEKGFIRQLDYERPDVAEIDDMEDETDHGNRPKALYLLVSDWKYYRPEE